MPDSDGQAYLFPIPDSFDGVQVDRDRHLLRAQNGHGMVIVLCIVLLQYAVGDRIAEAPDRMLTFKVT